MKIKITKCPEDPLIKLAIGSNIMIDGQHEFGQCVNWLLQNKKIAQKSIIAQDVEEITEHIVGVIVVDECEMYIDIAFAYVLEAYRRNGIFKMMLEKVKDYAKKKGKPIKIYCNKDLCCIYESCDFVKSENLAVMIYSEKENENV